MIKKIKSISSLAVFQDFNWDQAIRDKGNNICEFKDINILYGRNYSGKTTLSRIFRALETGRLSDKYGNPRFCISLKDGLDITESNFEAHNKKVRVFNEDFVKENLKFIAEPEENIESFAILGENNTTIEGEIKKIESELGSKEEGKETGFYAQLKILKDELRTSETNYKNADSALISKLSAKATGGDRSIKYNPLFQEPNYSIKRIQADIRQVDVNDFEPIDDKKKEEFIQLLKEETKPPIPSLGPLNLQFNDLSSKSKVLIEKKIGVSEKIDELLKEAILNKWVKEGIALHQGKRSKCAFCANPIQEGRWEKLEKHFDEESDSLEKEIKALIKKIDVEKDLISKGFQPRADNFYSKFQLRLNALSNSYKEAAEKYCTALDKLREQLIIRQNDIFNPNVFKAPIDVTNELLVVWDDYEKVRIDSNDFTDSLNSEQASGRTLLRLNEVYHFISDIKYSEECERIKELKELLDEVEVRKKLLDEEIKNKERLIELKKRELKDESKGADKVNEYLNNFFGHGFLTLNAIEVQTEGETSKQFRFEITRDGEKAYHLSEGECSLVAFCYFMAKLEDVETKDSKPIIWIDDPISSLDGNHVFFIYSLISSEIVIKCNFEQLFISTHNLDFLKFLKRLKGNYFDHNSQKRSYKQEYLIIQRNDKVSTIQLMPNYLKEYVTEFNFLFHQIYNCSNIEGIDDSNFNVFYNFGNNARKFLEVYLYYKYPDGAADEEKIQKFFGNQKIPAVLTDRINNEYSHLSGVFERGSIPIEVPEMKSAAELILRRIEETDPEQYRSLLKSIGINVQEASLNDEVVSLKKA
jgi:wobble nucleotide-excising tRNase